VRTGPAAAEAARDRPVGAGPPNLPHMD
jgi:hypothetical protein